MHISAQAVYHSTLVPVQPVYHSTPAPVYRSTLAPADPVHQSTLAGVRPVYHSTTRPPAVQSIGNVLHIRPRSHFLLIKQAKYSEILCGDDERLGGGEYSLNVKNTIFSSKCFTFIFNIIFFLTIYFFYLIHYIYSLAF